MVNNNKIHISGRQKTRRKIQSVLIVLFIIIGIIPSFIFVQNLNSNYQLSKETSLDNRLRSSSLTPHSGIYLSGEDAVTSFFSGNGTSGTKADPHLIQNYVIDTSGGISIYGTQQYIVIDSCVITESN